ncbi:MAG: hypothetical protein HYU77_14210 [Betaproteobacteria bacterium]|nr:hypothetical protein [Betaproteobacteria bacterium]
MAENPSERMTEAAMDAANLYREEIVTDRRVGTIRVLVPVKSDGSTDPARKTLYVGDAQVYTNVGPLPLSFEINANSLAEAVTNYAAAAKIAFDRALRELEDMRRQAASSIVIPRGGAGGLPGGGQPGGGKIQMP